MERAKQVSVNLDPLRFSCGKCGKSYTAIKSLLSHEIQCNEQLINTSEDYRHCLLFHLFGRHVADVSFIMQRWFQADESFLNNTIAILCNEHGGTLQNAIMDNDSVRGDFVKQLVENYDEELTLAIQKKFQDNTILRSSQESILTSSQERIEEFGETQTIGLEIG